MTLNVKGAEKYLALNGLGFRLEDLPIPGRVGQVRGNFLALALGMEIQIEPLRLRLNPYPRAQSVLPSRAAQPETKGRSAARSVV
jgi:hypothetical protein